jgi:hypothetical protein
MTASVPWSSTAPPEPTVVKIDGANYMLNGTNTSADFWGSPAELNPGAQHSVQIAGVPEPSTWIMLMTAGFMVPIYTKWGRRRV